MKVDAIYNYNSPSYKGAIFKDGAFKQLEQKLSGQEKDTLETIVKNIENTKDDHKWWFGTQTIQNGKVRIAVIGKVRQDGTPKRPGCFLDEEKNSLELFKKLAKWYKDNVKGYKE